MAIDPETRPLLGGRADEIGINSQKGIALYRNFLTMCIAFSLNHGCVVSCLAYASTELGSELGGSASGVLYVFYSLTAFLLSKPIVAMVGPKYGLLLGVLGYCVYIAGFLFAILVPALAWPVFLISAAIGGIAGGLLWPSQGRYFARNAKLYSEATGIPVSEVNATFAGIFATSYLGLETVTKVLATLIFLSTSSADAIVFTVYTVLAFSAVLVVVSLSELEDFGTFDFSTEIVIMHVGSAGRLVYEDIRLALMLPFQIAFGFTSSFVPYYIFGTVIAGSANLGGTYVGLLSAVIVLTGAATAIPAAWAANTFGKPIVMSVGGFCLAFAGFMIYFMTDAQLGVWGAIVPYLIVYGVGRGTWENTNKAVIADLFADTPELTTAAFAAISFSNGFAGAIGYFTFSSIGRYAMATIVTVTSFLAIFCYLVAAHIHSNRQDMIAASKAVSKQETKC